MPRPIGTRNGGGPAQGYPELDDCTGGFLAGFLEGEASFLISKQAQNTNHRTSAKVNLRDDDAPLLHELSAQTGLGKISRLPARASSKPQACWTIGSKSDCLRLVQILERFPLRGHKAGDADLWSAAVRWWTGGDPGTTHRYRDWEPMIYLKARLLERRRIDRVPRPIVDTCSRELELDWLAFLSGFITAESHRAGRPAGAPRRCEAVSIARLSLPRLVEGLQEPF
jgi:hypothetical protein